MPQSRTIHTSDGLTQQFSVSFPYLSRAHVSVTVAGVPTAITAWINDTTIQLTPAPAAGAVNNIEIQRTTPDGLVSFSNGTALTEEDLNTAVLAAQYQTEEALEARTILNLPTYANDTAAGAGGLTTDEVYKTASGELRIKL